MKVYFDKIKKLIWINSKIDLDKIKKYAEIIFPHIFCVVQIYLYHSKYNLR